VPVHDIKLRFDGYAIKRFHLEPDATTLNPTRDGDASVVSLPPLAIHYMVVAELQ